MARAGSADLPDGESEIFFADRLDRFLVICPSGSDEAPSRDCRHQQRDQHIVSGERQAEKTPLTRVESDLVASEVQWRFLGLSLAGYNVLISLLMAAIAGWGFVAARRANHKNLSSRPAKNISLSPSGKSALPTRAIPRPSRGALRDRHERWVRDAVDAAARETSCDCWRTAKSCGPDTPTLVSSSREANAFWQ